MLAETEDTNIITLPESGDVRRWDDYIGSKRDITISLGNFSITKLHTGHPYWQLRTLFHIEDFLSVTKFISQNPTLYSTLLEIEEAIRMHFPEEKLRLALYADPEGEMNDELAIYILTKDEPRTALAKLDEFDNNFWLDKIDQYGGLVLVNLRYQ